MPFEFVMLDEPKCKVEIWYRAIGEFGAVSFIPTNGSFVCGWRSLQGIMVSVLSDKLVLCWWPIDIESDPNHIERQILIPQILPYIKAFQRAYPDLGKQLIPKEIGK